MPGRATITAISGLCVGVGATLLVTGEGPQPGAGGAALMMATRLAAMVCTTAVALATLRRWIRAHDQRTQQVAEQVAQERAAYVQEGERRARELADREDRLNRRAESVSAYVMGIARRLDEALTRTSHLERELADLTTRYEELAEDHNRLIRETLQERADRFGRRPTTPCPPPAPPSVDHPVRPYVALRRGHHQVPTPLRRVPAPATTLAEQPQHERPVEGVSGQV
jgi:hypothetical protein